MAITYKEPDREDMMPDGIDNVGLPKLPKYKKNSLRPFPRMAQTRRGRPGSVGEEIPGREDMAFARGTIMIGNFGDEDTPASVACGIAKVRPAFGLPPENWGTPGNEDSETQAGWR